MVRVVLLGFGNVGQHLYKAMQASSHMEVVQIYSRSFVENLPTPQTKKISDIEEAAMYIIAVPDDAIGHFSESLPFENRLVVHVSGGVHMKVLANKNRRGVFYPLQTFSKNKQVDFSKIPICVEAENENDLQLLKETGSYISEKVVEISSIEREQLHVAAVFVNNFTNHLYHVAERITANNGLDFNLLKPLIAETANKIETLTTSEAQTGPAKRNDSKTIQKHIDLLEGSEFLNVYKVLTNAISNSSKQN
jgi:predicted short-subunit dehydrogenase-like oxidoreductase (DUF2520 family)